MVREDNANPKIQRTDQENEKSRNNQVANNLNKKQNAFIFVTKTHRPNGKGSMNSRQRESVLQPC